MRKLVMINGCDLRQVQGVNYVNDYFVKGKSYFNDIKLSKIYGSSQTIDVASGGQMPIGGDVGSTKYLAKRGIRSFLRKLLSSEVYPFALLKYYLNFIRPAYNSINKYLHSGEKADYILFHGVLSAYLYYKRYNGAVPEKCAMIVHAADDDMGQFFDQFPAFKGKKQVELLRQRDYVYEHIDKVVYISQKACDNSKLRAEKKCVVYNGIDDYPYEFSDVIKDTVNFICVGSMSGRKGQELIIQAFSLLDKDYLQLVHLYLVGDGPDRSNLETLVNNKHLADYVTFTGARNDVPEILRTQDVFIMPSKDEGLSIATLEGIRAGLFMLLTDTGGNKEVMGDKGGFVIERDASDIKDKICQILDEGLINKEQKERSRKHFLHNFTTQHFISGYEKMFHSL